jgi:hypothetical protein
MGRVQGLQQIRRVHRDHRRAQGRNLPCHSPGRMDPEENRLQGVDAIRLVFCVTDAAV